MRQSLQEQLQQIQLLFIISGLEYPYPLSRWWIGPIKGSQKVAIKMIALSRP